MTVEHDTIDALSIRGVHFDMQRMNAFHLLASECPVQSREGGSAQEGQMEP